MPEKSTGSASLTTIRRRTVSTGRCASRTSPSDRAVVLAEPSEPVGDRRRFLGRRGDDAGQQAGLDDEPGLRDP